MNRKLVIAVVAASALAVGGTTAAFAGDADGSAAPSGAPSQERSQGGPESRSQDDGRGKDDDRTEDARALSGAELSAKEAIDKALASVNGTVESIELDDEDSGRPAWEADVLGDDGTWHEVRVDADSGKVTQETHDRAGDADDRDDRDRDDADDRTDDRDDRTDDRDDRDDA